MLLLFAHFYGVSQRQSLNSRLQNKSKAAKGCACRWVYGWDRYSYMYLQLRLSSVLVSVFVSVSLALSASLRTLGRINLIYMGRQSGSCWRVLLLPPLPSSLSLFLPPSRSLLCIAASPSIAIAAKRNTKFAQIFIALFLQRLLGSLSVGVRQCVCVCAGICVRQCVCNLGEFICHIPTI